MLLTVVKDVAGTTLVGSCVMTHQHTNWSVYHHTHAYIHKRARRTAKAAMPKTSKAAMPKTQAHREGGDAEDRSGRTLTLADAPVKRRRGGGGN